MQVILLSNVLVVDLNNNSYPYLAKLDAQTGELRWSYQAREAHQFLSEESAHTQIVNFISKAGYDVFKDKLITFRKVVKYGTN